MSKQTIKIDCTSCNGKGLYQGFAERGGAAVICTQCGGTGCQKYEYFPFKGKKIDYSIRKVFACNVGYVINDESPHGIDYTEWVANSEKPFNAGNEDRERTCPELWGQLVPWKKARKPEWDECIENWGSRITDCKHFPEKAKCWARLDKERGL